VTISAGGTVTWTWRGSSSHTVTSDDNGATFDSSPPRSSGTFSHTFPNAGSFPYHCEVHGLFMAGTITVQ
jgi:plastocyanin